MRPLRLVFEGREVAARPGDSIAAALAAANEIHLGQRRSGARRGVFCGMGVCHDCLVTVDGRRGMRACMTPVRDGMQVLPEAELRLAGGTEPEQAAPVEAIEAEIAIIGAGPAGLTAAIRAARAGAGVLVLDEREETGGQYFKPRSDGYRGAHGTDRQHRRGMELRQRAEASGARIFTGHSVWFARRRGDGFDLRSLGRGQSLRIAARAVILASGAAEIPAIVPGWTLPGVLTIGAAQTHARRYGVAPQGRILVAGNGPLGLQLAAELTALGGNVVALAERGTPGPGAALLSALAASPQLVADGAGYRLAAARAGVPILAGWELSQIRGAARAEGATLRDIGSGQTRTIAAEHVIAGDGFAPQLELARLLGVPIDVDPGTGALRPRRDAEGRTPVGGLWIAGDAGGLGGAEIAACQGQLSVAAALAFIGKAAAGDLAPAGRRLRRAHRFQTALWSMYRAPARALPQDETILCRCLEVTLGTARAAVAGGATDPATLKRATRIGMGRCQGRYCLPLTLRLLAEAGHPAAPEALSAPQIPARPVPVGAIALEKPEWRGHRESLPAERPARPVDEPLGATTADLVIIGGGITGIAAALYAARAGASVVCLDRGRVNGEASGGNAGSLHLQLLSWDFGHKAVGDGSLQLRTLPLQHEAIALWQSLEAELDADFEMRVTGGLMVAERPEHLAFLEDKVAAEARVGIRSEVIDAARVRSIAPAISEAIIGAAWCPGEGKINPLAATPALARAARGAGALIEEFAPVTGLARSGDGYLVQTPRSNVAAPRILIATGGWSNAVAGMLGGSVPVRGAPLQMVVTAPGPPLVPCLLAHASRHLTMKQAASGSVIIGGAWPARTAPNGQAEVLAESLEGNLWVAARTVPQVGSLQMIRSWAAMNIDIDGAPLIGPLPGFEGVWVAATANGYTLGPLMGRESAAMALAGRIRQDLKAFSMERFEQGPGGAGT